MSAIIISVVGIGLMLFGLEKTLRLVWPDTAQWGGPLYFFSEGTIFQNQSWGGFVFQANARIYTRTLYITDPKGPTVVDQSQYEIRTNSSGLVQLADIIPTKPSIVFLGDSFMEGQGAVPWFYELEKRWPSTVQYQVINGGIMGTGIEAWERLYNHLPLTTKDKKIVIVFVGSSWIRPPWQISQSDLECVRFPVRCTGANEFIGLPNEPENAENQIRRIAAQRVRYTDEQYRRNILKDSAIYQHLLKPAYHSLWPFRTAEDIQFDKSALAVHRMVDSVGGNNLLLIHLPTKDELPHNFDPLSKRSRDFIRSNGYQFVDGFEKCHLTMDDYYEYEGHPNSDGYAKIRDCVEDAVRETFHLF